MEYDPNNPTAYYNQEPGSTAYRVPGMPTELLVQEEATETEVQKERRKQKALAITVAIAVHVIIGLIVTLIVIGQFEKETPEIVAVSGDATVSDDVKAKTFQTPSRQQPSASSNKVSKVLAANAMSSIPVPVVEDIVNDDPVEFGDLGNSLGAGLFGNGSLGSFLPASMSSRCTHKDRETRLAESGGKPEAEEAVIKGLNWLKSQQNEDGSVGKGHKAAMTGLTLLAYLGHCETPDSKEFGDSCLNSILWLVELGMKNDGRLTEKKSGHQWVYEHAIATYSLAEAYSITKYGKRKIPRIREVLEKSVPLIIQGQMNGGGWAYEYNKSGRRDLSVAGWQVQALKASMHTKIEFEGINTAMENAMKFMRDMQGGKGGFGYSDPGDKLSLSGAGALALVMGTGNSRDRDVRRAVEYIVDSTRHDYQSAENQNSLYGWYYSTQACFQVGGSNWTKWNRGFQDELLKNQADSGVWKPEGNSEEGAATTFAAGGDADIYRTALCCLMLEVYYRYLPATETKAPQSADNPLGF